MPGNAEHDRGTLYNGGTTDKGGAIKLTNSATANLSGVLISNCWSDKAITYQNEGGAIYMESAGNRLTCENVDVISCSTDENNGGGVYQDYGETNWIGGNIVSCRTGDDGGGFYVNNDKVYMKNVLFAGNSSHDNGGAFCSDSDDGAWFMGCTFQRNTADDLGGAIYIDNDNIYMEDCSVISNTSGEEGGGIYLARPSTIGVAGVVIIRNNDGSGSHDNLVLEKNAYLYNHGLQPGSEIRLRSESDGSVELGESPMSEYQMNQYFRIDYGKQELTETKKVNTELRASTYARLV